MKDNIYYRLANSSASRLRFSSASRCFRSFSSCSRKARISFLS